MVSLSAVTSYHFPLQLWMEPLCTKACSLRTAFRVIDTLKEYAIKALVNTVDHLGSVAYQINDFLDEKAEEVCVTEMRVSCVEQRLRTCQEYIDREGMSQQSSILDTPKFHKRYILPAGQTMKYKSCGMHEDDWYQFRSAVRATIRDTPSTIRDTPSKIRDTPSSTKETPPFARRGWSISPTTRSSRLPGSFSFSSNMSKKDKQLVSPQQFLRMRSGSLALRLTPPKSSKPTTPNSPLESQQYQRDSWKSMSTRFDVVEKKPKDMERQPSKSKRLLKALLSKRKSKKDEMLFTYLDEY